MIWVRMRRGARSASAPGRGGRRRRGILSECYREGKAAVRRVSEGMSAGVRKGARCRLENANTSKTKNISEDARPFKEI